MDNIREISFNSFKWIDIVKPQNEQLEKISQDYHLDFLQVSDSFEHGHLPKFEKLPEYSFIILRAFTAQLDDRYSTVSELTNKIAFFYNGDRIITIRRFEFDFLTSINQSFSNTEELLLFIINKMVQTFIKPSERHNKKIDLAERDMFLKDYTKISLEELYLQKSQTRICTKLLEFSLDVVEKITVSDPYKTRLQDIRDRLTSLILIYEEVSEDANNLMTTYLSVTATRNNDVMKLLTIFSAFFLPLTFVVGLYGMNFSFMPELHWKYGYFVILLIMLVISLLIFYWFKRKRIM